MAERRPILGTVRLRLTAGAMLALVVVLVATGAVLVSVQRHLLTEDLDDDLRARAAALVRLVEHGQLPRTITGQGDDDAGAQVVDGSGRVLARTANLAGAGPLVRPGTATAGEVRTVRDIPIDPSSFRILTRRVGATEIHVVSNPDDIGESVERLRTALLVVGPAVALVLGALTWWLVGRMMRPVEAIRAEVARISGTDLHRRVPEPEADDEIGRLARTMNAMLERIDESARRQEQFVADASHELRSPLARIRSELEVDLAHPDTADPWATHRSVLDEAVGLQGLVDDLLQLARGGGDTAAPLRLDEIVRRVAARSPGQVEVDAEEVTVTGDGPRLGRAIGNVVDNAARVTTTTVRVTVGVVDGQAEVAVVDDGPGIPPDQAEAVFERFRRLDESRTASTGGAGLGLSIAREIVTRHGGTITFDTAHRGGARVVVRLPLVTGAKQ